MNGARSRNVVLLALAICMGSESSASSYAYKLYPGPRRELSEIATVHIYHASVFSFDGRIADRNDWDEVQMLPGVHTIGWIRFGSYTSHAKGFAPDGDDAIVDLLAGHVYSFRAAMDYGHQFWSFFWMVDDTDKLVIAGTPKKSEMH